MERHWQYNPTTVRRLLRSKYGPVVEMPEDTAEFMAALLQPEPVAEEDGKDRRGRPSSAA
jgi:hypothetical protein